MLSEVCVNKAALYQKYGACVGALDDIIKYEELLHVESDDSVSMDEETAERLGLKGNI